MRNMFTGLLLVLLLGGLAACGATGTQVQPATESEPAAGAAATDANAAAEAAPDAPDAPTEGVEKTIYVASETMPCVGVAPQDCLQIRESPDAEWQLFYDQIEGFTFDPGFEYELRVREEQVENPPADAASLRLVLIEEVSRTAVATATDPLAGTAWQIETLAGAPPAEGTQVTLAFNEQGRYNANAGCNTFNGDYAVNGETISFMAGISTMMACPDPIGTQEMQFIQALEAATSFALSEGQLTITYGEGDQLVFGAQAADASDVPPTAGDELPPLVATDWVLTSFIEGGSETPVIENTTPALSFLAGDQFRGSTGCNTMRGVFTLDGDAMTVEVGPVTRRGCPPDISEQETRLLMALAEVARFEQTDTGLILFYGSDGQLVFAPIAPIDEAPTTDQSLGNTEWELVSFNELDAAFPLVENTTISLRFDAENTVGGNAGCNVFSGSYTAEQNRVQFGEGFVTTEMACEEPVLEQEQQFLTALETATTYERNDNVLIINYGERDRALVFRLGEPMEDTGTMDDPTNNALADTAWRLTALVKDGTTTSVVTGDGPAREAGMAFRADGRASGSGGCNIINASYTVDGNTISFGPAMSTMMACEESVMDQELLFAQTLEIAASFTIDGDTLTISSADGAAALVFERTASAE